MRTKRAIIAIGLLPLLFCVSANSMAENKAKSLTLSPFFGGYLFGNDQDIKSKPAYGLGIGYNLSKKLSIEGAFNYIDTESKEDNSDIDALLYNINALYHFTPYKKLLPYISAGIGAITLNYQDEGDDTDFTINYGAGLKYFLNESIALRGDIKRILSFNESHHNLLYTIGLTFYFGGDEKKEIMEEKIIEPPKPKKPKVLPPKAPADLKSEKVVVKPPKDTDGDGIRDSLDRCPETPLGIAVDSSGCPVDTDGDGVADYLDKCPETPKGVQVNVAGCWVCKGIRFDFDKWDIKPEFYPNLNNIVDYLKKKSDVKIEIQGHTDNVGTKKYNKVLSEKRAREVLRYFVKEGITKERLYAVGYGLSRPVASNETEEGQSKNRRVQFKIMY